jgi:hypothetical protein
MKEVVVGSPAAVPHVRRLGASPVVMRGFAVFLGLHGVAHLAGTSGSFTKAAEGESVDYLAGAWTLSDPTVLRAVGVVWALASAAFVFAAAIAWMRRPEWPRALVAVSAFSLVVVVVALWSSVIGVVIDVALLAVAGGAGGLSRAGAQR